MDKGGMDPAAVAVHAQARAHFRMDRTERFYKIDHLIRERGIVPVKDFLRELEVSLATFKRDIEYMRSRHHAPIEWDRDAGGYRLVLESLVLSQSALRYARRRTDAK
jgi:predicted DNA-binding transcriptional regulator YafY